MALGEDRVISAVDEMEYTTITSCIALTLCTRVPLLLQASAFLPTALITGNWVFVGGHFVRTSANNVPGLVNLMNILQRPFGAPAKILAVGVFDVWFSYFAEVLGVPQSEILIVEDMKSSDDPGRRDLAVNIVDAFWPIYLRNRLCLNLLALNNIDNVYAFKYRGGHGNLRFSPNSQKNYAELDPYGDWQIEPIELLKIEPERNAGQIQMLEDLTANFSPLVELMPRQNDVNGWGNGYQQLMIPQIRQIINNNAV